MRRARVHDVKKIVMLGAGGTGMRNLAHLLLAAGKDITAVDAATEDLRSLSSLRGATICDEQGADSAVAAAEVLIHSAAVSPDHSLLILANERGVPILPYHEAVADIAADKKVIAVAGTHGKSSTTALLSHILIAAGKDPTALLGADVPAWGGAGSRAGSGDLFVLEADEYEDHFLSFRPAAAIVTNIDFDHPDYFSSLAAVEKSFDLFLRRVEDGGVVLTLPDVLSSFPDLSWPKHTELATDFTFDLPPTLHGNHMRRNAGLAVAMAVYLGASRAVATGALSTFSGLSRRTEHLGNYGGLDILSDYGHHPAALAATYAAVKEARPGQRVAILFEPHMLARLKLFYDGFLNALSSADSVFLAPVFVPSGRDYETAESDQLLKQMHTALQDRRVLVHMLSRDRALSDVLEAATNEADALILFSAGSLDQQLRALVKNS